MASDTDAVAELVLLYQAADSNLYWTSCALALLAYDYLLTLRREVRFVWSRKFSPATVLFLLNRYAILLLYLVDVITLFPIIPEVRAHTCSGVGRFITVLEVIPYIIWATFSGLRVYALSSRTLSIGAIVFLLSLVPAGVNAYFFSTFTFVDLDPPSNCTALSDITAELSKTKTVTIVSRASLMAADVLVIAVTWASTYRIGKASREARLGTSFGTLLLRDGTLEPTRVDVLLAMNVVHMTLNTVKPNDAVQQASYVTVLENPITSILISRFILNLRAVDDRGAGGCHDEDTYSADAHPSFVRTYSGARSDSGAGRARGRRHGSELKLTMRFARSVVDTFGASLDYGDEEDGGRVEDEERYELAQESGARWGPPEEVEKARSKEEEEAESSEPSPVSPAGAMSLMLEMRPRDGASRSLPQDGGGSV
ncbi:hypothetical protein BV20DRAFT_939448 [Pilatotrama ljubarskyi]|nr:hypothetical protein BV20DRAFT_939448 [Pilatotrama ljubarskyi]